MNIPTHMPDSIPLTYPEPWRNPKTTRYHVSDQYGPGCEGDTPSEAYWRLREQAYRRGVDQGVGMFADWLADHPNADPRAAALALRKITHAMRLNPEKNNHAYYMSVALSRLSRVVKTGRRKCPCAYCR